MSKWISLHTKLPKECVNILFTNGKKVYHGWLECHHSGEEPVFFETEYKEWVDDVTHWMKLPRIPK